MSLKSLECLVKCSKHDSLIEHSSGNHVIFSKIFEKPLKFGFEILEILEN